MSRKGRGGRAEAAKVRCCWVVRKVFVVSFVMTDGALFVVVNGEARVNDVRYILYVSDLAITW